MGQYADFLFDPKRLIVESFPRVDDAEEAEHMRNRARGRLVLFVLSPFGELGSMLASLSADHNGSPRLALLALVGIPLSALVGVGCYTAAAADVSAAHSMEIGPEACARIVAPPGYEEGAAQ
jgi:hypothetical protein